ncbi:hypothetical protein [Granulicella arctica]|uniref:Uncharacterized protein n=1 Tax=Granulicella arctica TaxID=940613 RepID=A0A7Y9TQZ3_9BACT|nr:hypothetical protein [Granulicella arctica]NYF77743.1 hypothetical protein [Granulicella arctica]
MKLAFQNFGSLLLLGTALCGAQTTNGAASDKPLPEIPALMHEVEAHEKTSEALVKDYLYHSFAIEHALDSHGAVKKSQTEDADIFYVAGVRIERLTKKNGTDLSPDEQKKESQRIDKEIAKAKEKQAKPDDEDRDVVTVSRFLELGSFSKPRRVLIDGRDTIAVDFTGNPKAKTRTRFEAAIRDMAGTIWVDEQDRALRKIDGHFVNTFKVGAGLLADIKKDSSFEAEWTKINGEVWLPSVASGKGSIRVLLLLNFNGTLEVQNSNYRKFKATATILPSLGTVEPETPEPVSPNPPQ